MCCADLHMAQLMPLPLTVSCFSKIQIGFTFLVPAHLDSPRQKAVKRVCVCVWRIMSLLLLSCLKFLTVAKLLLCIELCNLWMMLFVRYERSTCYWNFTVKETADTSCNTSCPNDSQNWRCPGTKWPVLMLYLWIIKLTLVELMWVVTDHSGNVAASFAALVLFDKLRGFLTPPVIFLLYFY